MVTRDIGGLNHNIHKNNKKKLNLNLQKVKPIDYVYIPGIHVFWPMQLKSMGFPLTDIGKIRSGTLLT